MVNGIKNTMRDDMNERTNLIPSSGTLASIDHTIVDYSLGSWVMMEYENMTLDTVWSSLV